MVPELEINSPPKVPVDSVVPLLIHLISFAFSVLSVRLSASSSAPVPTSKSSYIKGLLAHCVCGWLSVRAYHLRRSWYVIVAGYPATSLQEASLHSVVAAGPVPNETS